VQIRSYATPTVLSEADMVHGPEDGLEEEQDEYNNSENGMIVMVLQLL
jgi:nitrogenase molybdenum-iron protein alpha/beta subunit